MNLAAASIAISTAADILRQSNDEADRVVICLKRHKTRRLEADIREFLLNEKGDFLGAGSAELLNLVMDILDAVHEETGDDRFDCAARIIENAACEIEQGGVE